MASNIKIVGVIGAGQMGSGIAHVCALAGFHVKLQDLAPDRIKAGIATINGNMRGRSARRASPKTTAKTHSSVSLLPRVTMRLRIVIS